MDMGWCRRAVGDVVAGAIDAFGGDRCALLTRLLVLPLANNHLTYSTCDMQHIQPITARSYCC